MEGPDMQFLNWFSVSLCTSLTAHHHSTHSCP